MKTKTTEQIKTNIKKQTNTAIVSLFVIQIDIFDILNTNSATQHTYIFRFHLLIILDIYISNELNIVHTYLIRKCDISSGWP